MTTPPDLHGHVADASDPKALLDAVDLAFDYRGDITITRSAGDRIEGYLFDRGIDRAGRRFIRLIPKGTDERLLILMDDVVRIEFSGKDTASGKSFENWVRKYAHKKLAGEAANIESESLDEA